jgi:phage terminase large subunit-like protein
LRDGTYRADRHGPLSPSILDYPKPAIGTKPSKQSQRRWIRSAADEHAVANGCWFNEELAEHAANFFPKFLRHSKGQWAGQPFALLDWQRNDLIYPLFGWLRADKTRRYRRAFCEVPKKNGKSTIASGVGLYMLVADEEPGAEVYSAASDRDQAGIVHGEAMRMAEASDVLASCLKINRSTKNILYNTTGSWYRALSSEPGGKEGLNIHCAIIDELHVWHGRDLWDTLRYGYRSRRQPLQFVITTAGDDDQSVCYRELERCRQILDGRIYDDAYFTLIYEAQPDDDWTDPAVWAKANPSLGQTFSVESLAEDCEAAKGRPTEERVFKRYSLNIWSRGAKPWLSPETWAAAAVEVRPDMLEGKPCYAGLDLSRTRDMTACVLTFVLTESDGPRYVQVPKFWLPRVAIEKYRNAFDLEGWHAAGLLDYLDGDFEPVKAYIRQCKERYALAGVVYDPAYAFDLAKELREQDGIECIPFPQTIKAFAFPTAEYERLLAMGTLQHDGNPVMTWQAGHVQVANDRNNNKRPVKPSDESTKKVDGIVAGIMSLDLALRKEPISDGCGVVYAGDQPEEVEVDG